jgi:hypothetical protein
VRLASVNICRCKQEATLVGLSNLLNRHMCANIKHSTSDTTSQWSATIEATRQSCFNDIACVAIFCQMAAASVAVVLVTRNEHIITVSATACGIQESMPRACCSAPAQLALSLSHSQPVEQLQAYPREGGGRSLHEPLTALSWLLQGLLAQASRSAGRSSGK